MFESPLTLIESKKQKTAFEDVDGSKVVAYLEKDSPGIHEPKAKEGIVWSDWADVNRGRN